MNRILAALSAVLFFCAPSSAAVLGEQRAIVLNVCFSDYCPQSWTVQASQDMVNVTTNMFYDQVADPDNTLLNPPFFSATAYGWWVLPISQSDCVTSVLDAAVQAATDHGVDAAAFPYVVLSYPARQGFCASDIPRGSYGKLTGRIYAVSWIPGTTLDSYAFEHELGHNIRNQHAHAIHCGAIPLAADWTTCTRDDGGWIADIMGTGPAGVFNAFADWYMGWRTPQIVTADGTYTLRPTEQFPDALQMLRYTDPVTGLREFIMAERRQCIGPDLHICNFTSQNYTTGVVFTFGQETSPNAEGIIYHASEIDMTPGDGNPYNAALQVGQCWQDPRSGVSFEVQSSTPGGAATVYVSMIGGCAPPPAPPTNNPPVANPDGAAMPWNSTAPIIVPVLVNDSDPDGDPLTIISVTQGSKGTTAIVASGIRYTPNKPMRGSDSFSYKISDGRGGTASASVTVTAAR